MYAYNAKSWRFLLDKDWMFDVFLARDKVKDVGGKCIGKLNVTLVSI